ncbi:uncharacterized protein VP01_1220g8 [Puccinia sorghi]|uniref:Uncharacterized protein n=1 Tax=Puccinia sorghi TaxID=27349 RepID=A0A0L6VRJ9_9BASI|nr:uncharacterized protein VP01_1220g8 [Puccinia sorghi]
MKALTGPDGELGQIGSEEDLAACLQTYLDYWASEGISGFPIEALKVIIWMDSYEPTVTEKEALDISLSFDRLCRLIATGFPQDGPGTMFDYPTSFLESPIWSSFLDHHGWPPHHPQDPSPSFPRHSSLTSLDSLHHSPPSTHEKFLRSGIDTLLVPDPLTGLYTDPNQSSDNHSEPQNYQPDLSAENYHQFRYKRDSIGSAHHQTFLSNLRRFVLLLS